MNEQATPAQAVRSGGSDMIVIGAVAVLILGAIWFFSGGERALHRSATGFEGLVTWLRADGTEARVFRGGATLIRGEVGLRILPLYDTDLSKDRERPDSREAVIAETSEKDIETWIVRQKIESLPTLIILPKWRAGMRKLGVAHEDLLIPEREINRLLGQLGLGDEIPLLAEAGFGKVRVRRDPGGYRTQEMSGEGNLSGLMLGALHLQTIQAEGCRPLIGTAEHMVLAECQQDGFKLGDAPKAGADGTDPKADQTHVWVLADPDIMSNHGLRLARNAAAARDIVAQFDTEKPVILDTTSSSWTVEEDWQANRHERTWEDFSRMFAWPFTMIWIAFAFVGALVFWRAWVRYGPLARIYRDEPRAAKTVSIDAKARLLRLSNHDGLLLADHIKARLGALVADLMGPHRPVGRDPLETLRGLIGRKSPELAAELTEAAELPASGTAPSAEMLRRLDRFETVYDRIRHEFGRTPHAG